MNGRLVVALLIALAGQVLYHLSQKNVPGGAHPVVSLIVFYAVAMVCSLPLFLLFPLERSVVDEARQMDRAVVLVGVSIVLIELGFLLAYRAGGELSTAFVFTSAAVAASLLLLGVLRFGESLSWSKLAGIGLAMVSIGLLARK